MISTHSTTNRRPRHTLTTGQRASLIYLWASSNGHGDEMDRLIAARFLATADSDGCFTMKREDLRLLVPRGDWAIAEVVGSLEHSGLVERLGRTSWRLCPALLASLQHWIVQEAATWTGEDLVLPELPIVPVLTPRTGTDVEQSEMEEQWGLFGTDREHAFHFEHSDAAERVYEAGVEAWQQLALFNASLPVTCAEAHGILAAIAATFRPEEGVATIEAVHLQSITGLGPAEVGELMIQLNKQRIYEAWLAGTTWRVCLTALGAAAYNNYATQH